MHALAVVVTTEQSCSSCFVPWLHALCLCMVCTLHCKLCYITHEHQSSHGIVCHISQCTKLADDTSPSNDYLACIHAVCQHVGASQVYDEMRKTSRFGETRFVSHVPSSS